MSRKTVRPATAAPRARRLSIFKDRLKGRERFVGVRIGERVDVYPALEEFFGGRGLEA